MSTLWYHPSVCLQRLEETIKSLVRITSSHWDSKQSPPLRSWGSCIHLRSLPPTALRTISMLSPCRLFKWLLFPPHVGIFISNYISSPTFLISWFRYPNNYRNGVMLKPLPLRSQIGILYNNLMIRMTMYVWSSGLLRCVVIWLCANVSEDRTASIFSPDDGVSMYTAKVLQGAATQRIIDNHIAVKTWNLTGWIWITSEMITKVPRD
jgi:hypothetical protein